MPTHPWLKCCDCGGRTRDLVRHRKTQCERIKLARLLRSSNQWLWDRGWNQCGTTANLIRKLERGVFWEAHPSTITLKGLTPVLTKTAWAPKWVIEIACWVEARPEDRREFIKWGHVNQGRLPELLAEAGTIRRLGSDRIAMDYVLMRIRGEL